LKAAFLSTVAREAKREADLALLLPNDPGT
jgi:hypothetical protein